MKFLVTEGLKHAGIHHPLSRVFGESTVTCLSVLCAVKVGQQLTESLAHPHTNTLTNSLSFSHTHVQSHEQAHTQSFFYVAALTCDVHTLFAITKMKVHRNQQSG